jgi:hypothetical protein
VGVSLHYRAVGPAHHVHDGALLDAEQEQDGGGGVPGASCSLASRTSASRSNVFQP